MYIALDAMGGDYAPQETIAGALAALDSDLSLKLYLVGDQALIQKELDKFSYDKDRIKIHHCTEVITMDDNPLVKKPDSSINQGLLLVKQGKAAAFVSAGNTGALMGNSLLIYGRIQGIKRPAIATTIPKSNGYFLLLDSGANSESKPENLKQFAYLGTIFYQEVNGIKNPKLGILNIGTEKKKGPKEIQELYNILSSDTTINFQGNIEGNSLFFSDIDIVIADGFVGNIVLKILEGFAYYMLSYLKDIFKNTEDLDPIIAKKILSGLVKKLDSSEYGGGLLLGVDGITVKAHGSSNRKAISNVLQYANKLSQSKAINKFKENFKK